MANDTFECPSCALQAPKDAEECPYCGYEFPKQKTSVQTVAVIMALLLLYPVFKLVQYLLR